MEKILTVGAILPRNRGWHSSASRLGPATVENDMPTPTTTRPAMKTPRPDAAACRIEPMSSKNCPIWRTNRRPKRSEGTAANSDPAKPPMYREAVMRPSMEEEGCPMAIRETNDISGILEATISRQTVSGSVGIVGKQTDLLAMGPWTEKHL